MKRKKERAAPPDRLLRASEVEQLTSLSRMHIWRLEQDGQFPQRRKLGPNTVAWRLSEILEWLDALPRVPREPPAQPEQLKQATAEEPQEVTAEELQAA